MAVIKQHTTLQGNLKINFNILQIVHIRCNLGILSGKRRINFMTSKYFKKKSVLFCEKDHFIKINSVYGILRFPYE